MNGNSKHDGGPWIIVSGVPRSGTSLMMNLIRTALGEDDDRIFGTKFPRERFRELPKKGDDETQAAYDWRMYVTEVAKEKSWDQILKDAKEDFIKAKDMNPNGFWESAFVKRGIKRNRSNFEKMNEYEAKDKPTYVKVVSNGLSRSDPKLVNRVIYMLRDPGSVAKSQERLIREMKFIDSQTMQHYNFWDEVGVVNSPEMFIQFSLFGAGWLSAFPQVPVHFVLYDDLISKPFETLERLQSFLGEGDFETAAKVINPKLKRSYPDLKDHPMREDAEKIYEMLVNRDWEGITTFATDRKSATARETTVWPCLRSRSQVNEHVCITCRTKPLKEYRGSAKATAMAMKPPIDWENMPCAYECVRRLDDIPLISINASIENNFWKDNASYIELAKKEQ